MMDMDDQRMQALEELSEAVRDLGVIIRINHNRGTLISLRGTPGHSLRLSIHEAILDHPAALADIPSWIRGRGRKPGPGMTAAITTIGTQQREYLRQHLLAAVPHLEPLGPIIDLPAMAALIHKQHFPGVPAIPVTWGSRRTRMRTRHIRFGAYFRKRGDADARIVINRALDQAWVARDFLQFVIYHEYCHHILALDPIRGETPHSPRFRSLERRFPNLPAILLWEKAHLDRFLSGKSAQETDTNHNAKA